MRPINAVALAGGLLTTIVLVLLHYLPPVPAWAIFIAWACFFHVGGAQSPTQGLITTVIHMSTGALAAWVSALAILMGPWPDGVGKLLWAPVLIGMVIALILRAGTLKGLAVTPAIIYGYASIWAFLGMAGHFDWQALTSLSWSNALLAVCCSIGLGAVLGSLNVRLVRCLSKPDTESLQQN